MRLLIVSGCFKKKSFATQLFGSEGNMKADVYKKSEKIKEGLS